VSTISLIGCSTSMALATGPTDEELQVIIVGAFDIVASKSELGFFHSVLVC